MILLLAVLLVDASNAFNSLNRQVALHNMQSLCPPLATVLIMMLFLCLLTIVAFFFSEGTTQGDPLAITMYSISVTPLIHALQVSGIRQVWFADDATAGGSLKGLHDLVV